MEKGNTALLLPDFNILKEKRRREFLEAVDKAVPGDVLVLIGGKNLPVKDSYKHLKFVLLNHSSSFGDAYRLALAAATELGVSDVVTFEEYSTANASWFIPYLGAGNIVESKKRNFVEMAVTELTNIVAFRSCYNAFSMNRVFTADAARLIKDSKLDNRALFVESTNILNKNGIKTMEIVKQEKDVKKKKMTLNEVVGAFVRSAGNKLSALYGVFGFMAYIFNLLFVYISLSVGFFYPLAILLGGEISAASNFIMNEKFIFKQRGLMSSAYRFGKYNTLALIPLVLDVLAITILAGYSKMLGHTLFTILSIGVVVSLSFVFLVLINKEIWSRHSTVIKV